MPIPLQPIASIYRLNSIQFSKDLHMRKLRKRTKITIACSLTLIVIIGGLTYILIPRFQGDKIDYDCSDFATQQAAQKYFDSQGGSPRKDVDHLDSDRDGKACEQLESASGTFHFLEGTNPSSIKSDPSKPTFDDIANGKAYINPQCTEPDGHVDYDKMIQGAYGTTDCYSFTPYR
jgi:hypothetical protein